MEMMIDANIVMAIILNEPTKPQIITATVPLLTFDNTMKRVGRDMKLNMVEVKNAGI